MPRDLYWISGSVPCWRVLVTLKEKGLEYNSHLVEASAGDLKKPPVTDLNPRGQVPAFNDSGVVVNESLAAMQYLEAAYPDPPLMPRNAASLALTLQRFHEATVLFSAFQPAFRKKMRRSIETEADEAAFKADLDGTRYQLSYFEGYLASGAGYIAGEDFSLADINLCLVLFLMMRAGAQLHKYPNLRRYALKIKDRPSIQQTWPPHWKESEDKDWLTDLL